MARLVGRDLAEVGAGRGASRVRVSFPAPVVTKKPLLRRFFCARILGSKGMAQLVEHDLAEVGAGRGASRVRVSFPAPVVTKKPSLRRFFCARDMGVAGYCGPLTLAGIGGRDVR